MSQPAFSDAGLPQPGSHSRSGDPGAARLRMLVVDDLADFAESVAAILRLDGHEVRVAFSGASALQAAEECAPEVALIDLQMPDMSGTDLAVELRARYGVDIVIIGLTGSAEIDIALDPRLQCMDHCLTKPVPPDKLQTLFGRPRS